MLFLGSYSRKSKFKLGSHSEHLGSLSKELYAAFICFQSVAPSVIINGLSFFLAIAACISCVYFSVSVKYWYAFSNSENCSTEIFCPKGSSTISKPSSPNISFMPSKNNGACDVITN